MTEVLHKQSLHFVSNVTFYSLFRHKMFEIESLCVVRYNKIFTIKLVIRAIASLPRRVFGHLEPGPATKFPRCIRVYLLSTAILKSVFNKN